MTSDGGHGPGDARRYSEEEFAEILRRASEMQARQAARGSAEGDGAPGSALDRPRGMALEEIQSIAREVGIDPIHFGIVMIVALAIGGFILTAPMAFYASYGITLAPDASLLSELRAPGAGLAVLGAHRGVGHERYGLRRGDVLGVGAVPRGVLTRHHPAGASVGAPGGGA